MKLLKFRPELFLLLIPFLANSQSIEEEALDWLTEYIKIDTINPPGNESRAVDFIANILEAEGKSDQLNP